MITSTKYSKIFPRQGILKKYFHSREWVLNEFKKGSTAILVATDVAARSVGVYFAQSFTIIIS